MVTSSLLLPSFPPLLAPGALRLRDDGPGMMCRGNECHDRARGPFSRERSHPTHTAPRRTTTTTTNQKSPRRLENSHDLESCARVGPERPLGTNQHR